MWWREIELGFWFGWSAKVRVSKMEEMVCSEVEGLMIRDLAIVKAWTDMEILVISRNSLRNCSSMATLQLQSSPAAR